VATSWPNGTTKVLAAAKVGATASMAAMAAVRIEKVMAKPPGCQILTDMIPETSPCEWGV
jgi:hypothetical protein